MGRYLLKDWMVLPISLIYRHLRQWAASFVVPWFLLLCAHHTFFINSSLSAAARRSTTMILLVAHSRYYYSPVYMILLCILCCFILSLLFGCKNLFLVGLKSSENVCLFGRLGQGGGFINTYISFPWQAQAFLWHSFLEKKVCNASRIVSSLFFLLFSGETMHCTKRTPTKTPQSREERM